MATTLRSSSFNVQPQLLECWLHLRLDAAITSSSSGPSKQAKKRRRGLDPLAKELAAAAGDRADPAIKQGQVS